MIMRYPIVPDLGLQLAKGSPENPSAHAQTGR